MLNRYCIKPRSDGRWELVLKSSGRAVVLFEEYERALAFIDTLPAPDRATIDLDERNPALQAAG